jgi:Galactose-3-O-sulfotransferase
LLAASPHVTICLLDREALIFLHIPKTAGTTLNRIIEWQYNPLSIYTVDPHRIRATVQRFRTLSEQRRRRFQVVRGHLFYGIHEYLPQGATYITMLREPVARVLSSYFFILRRPLHPLHRKLKKEKLGVEDLIALTPDKENLQCRFIGGIGKTGVCDRSVLDKAKEHLARSFRVVGISERFEESLLLMATKFGWSLSYYENRKVAKNRSVIDPGVIELIRQHNSLDLELYDFGTKLFEEDLRRNQTAVKEARMTMASVARPGTMKRFAKSSVGVMRFLTTKIASAV